MVDLSKIGESTWFSLPRFMPFGIKFEFSAVVSFSILFAINAIQAIGDISATTMGGLDREPTGSELKRGITAYGLSNIVSALFGGLPSATYSQNVGIVSTTKVSVAKSSRSDSMRNPSSGEVEACNTKDSKSM